MAYPASPQAAETPLKAHPEEPDVGSGDYDIALSPIDGDSTGQAQLESPTSKWLREESEQRHAASAKSNSLQTDRERHSARLITRPKSNGNDTQTYPFVNAPSQPKRCTAVRSAPPVFSFAPAKRPNDVDYSGEARTVVSKVQAPVSKATMRRLPTDPKKTMHNRTEPKPKLCLPTIPLRETRLLPLSLPTNVLR